MSDIITDIKIIRIKTDYAFSLSECKNAYEEAGRDVDKAIEALKSKIAPVEVKEMTEEEKADWEKYKTGAERRANRKAKISMRKGMSGRQRLIKENNFLMPIFAFAFFGCLIAGVITIIFAALKKVSVEIPISFIVLSVFSLVIFSYMHIQNERCAKMTDEEYSECLADEITRKKVVYLNYDNEAIQCPHCGSTNILLKEKKFSKSKAFIGMTAFGIKGAVFGIPSHKRVKCCCADCGHKFEAVRR